MVQATQGLDRFGPQMLRNTLRPVWFVLPWGELSEWRGPYPPLYRLREQGYNEGSRSFYLLDLILSSFWVDSNQSN